MIYNLFRQLLEQNFDHFLDLMRQTIMRSYFFLQQPKLKFYYFVFILMQIVMPFHHLK